MSTDPTTPFPSRDRPEDMPPSDPWGEPLPPLDAPPSDDPTLHTPPPYPTSSPPQSSPPPPPAPPLPAVEEPPPAFHTPPDGYPPPATESPAPAPPGHTAPVSGPPGYPPPVSGPPGYAPASGPPGYPPPVSSPPGYQSPVSSPPGYPTSVSGPPGYQSPVPSGFAGRPADSGQVIAQIGEITVTSTQIRTPAGVMPLAGSSWEVTDHWETEREIPGWAILAAVLGFLVLTVFSLLFLLIKQTTQQGTAQVMVSNGPHRYVARVPVADHARLQHVRDQVDYVRSLAR